MGLSPCPLSQPNGLGERGKTLRVWWVLRSWWSLGVFIGGACARVFPHGHHGNGRSYAFPRDGTRGSLKLMSKIVGIDLGTTISLVETVDSGILLAIAIAEGELLRP